MSLRACGIIAVLLLAPVGALAADPFAGFISRVQEELRALGFDAGPVNGDFGTKTQAALAQFQLSRAIPASGQLDDPTLAELGIKRDDTQDSGIASAGASAAAGPGAPADPATATSAASSSPERAAEPKPPYGSGTGQKPGS